MSPNEQFAHYKIIERIGYGGMAIVYKADNTRTGSTVALKVLHDQYSLDKEIIRRFNREADIFYRLKHPNIVPIINHGEIDNKFYIAMSYMAHGTLFERFGYQKEVELGFTIGLLEQIASALDYAHEQGVIHRDLKLENILLDENDTPYLADFGIAFLIDATRLTSHQVVSGTPLYMSPEQALGLEVSASSDIYSLTVMAYLMLTGYHPFTGKDPYTILNQHISQPPPPPSSVNEELPEVVDDVLLRGLEKKPSARFATANEFVIALKRTLDDERTQTHIRLDALNPKAPQTLDEYKTTVLGVTSPPASPSITSQPTTTVNPTSANKNRGMILGAVIVLVLIIGVVGLLALTQQQSGMELEQTSTSIVNDTGVDAVAFIDAPLNEDGKPGQVVRLKESPEPDSDDLGSIAHNEQVTLIGRSGPGDFIEIKRENGQTGFIKRSQLRTDADTMKLPITHRREDNNNAPSSRNRIDCDTMPDPPVGTIIALDGVDLLAVPRLNTEQGIIVPHDTEVKLISRDDDLEFIEIDLRDEDDTHGFVLSSQLEADFDLNCIRNRD